MKYLLIASVFLISCNSDSVNKTKSETNTVDSIVARLSQWTNNKTIRPRLYNSSTIKRLKGATETQISHFWDSIAKKGTPMIEHCDDTSSIILSFLYRDKRDDLKVLIDIKNQNVDSCFGGDMMLEHINKTDIWYKSFKIPKDLMASYRYIVTNKSATKEYTDKYNAHLIPIGKETDYSFNSFEFAIDSSNALYYERKGVSKGSLSEFSIDSKILKNSRSVVVYKPNGYNVTDEYPVIVIFDQFLYLERVPLHTILDNLIANNKIPPCVAIMIDNQPKERRELELPLYKPFADFVALELMPWAYNNFSITKDPNKSTIAGVSYGGLAASFIAFHHSNMFGNVLSQSGSYWRGINVTDSIPWLTEKYKSSPKLPIRFYLDCGLQETVMRSFSNFNFIEKHRYFRDVLKSKNYEIYYQEFQSGHDWCGWRKTLPDGLIVLFNKMEK